MIWTIHELVYFMGHGHLPRSMWCQTRARQLLLCFQTWIRQMRPKPLTFRWGWGWVAMPRWLVAHVVEGQRQAMFAKQQFECWETKVDFGFPKKSSGRPPETSALLVLCCKPLKPWLVCDNHSSPSWHHLFSSGPSISVGGRGLACRSTPLCCRRRWSILAFSTIFGWLVVLNSGALHALPGGCR